MPHLRQRHGLPEIFRKLKFARVVAIQGARQTGKSVVARELLPAKLKDSHYVTFDRDVTQTLADRSPQTFLAQYPEARPLIIDEAQKAPKIFEAVKLQVDVDPRPGQFVLLGSTEFSHFTRIRDALTGRMSRMRFYPLNLAETLSLPPNSSAHLGRVLNPPRISRAQWANYIRKGGLPGIFAIRDDRERQSLLQDWIDLTVQRDIHMLKGPKLDSGLCRSILELVATLDNPSAGEIAKKLRRDSRRVRTHLEALKTLFVIEEIPPHFLGAGKSFYYLLDTAIAERLGASWERCVETWLFQEVASQWSYRDGEAPRFFRYQTSRGSVIHLILEDRSSIAAIKILHGERFDAREIEVLKAFRVKAKETGKSIHTIALGGDRISLKKDKVEVFPWEAVG